jgi:hypothetical protein
MPVITGAARAVAGRHMPTNRTIDAAGDQMDNRLFAKPPTVAYLNRPNITFSLTVARTPILLAFTTEGWCRMGKAPRRINRNIVQE